MQCWKRWRFRNWWNNDLKIQYINIKSSLPENYWKNIQQYLKQTVVWIIVIVGWQIPQQTNRILHNMLKTGDRSFQIPCTLDSPSSQPYLLSPPHLNKRKNSKIKLSTLAYYISWKSTCSFCFCVSYLLLYLSWLRSQRWSKLVWRWQWMPSQQLQLSFSLHADQ